MDTRDLVASVLTGVGTVLAAVGAGLWFGAAVGVTVAGIELAALGIALGYRPGTRPARESTFTRPAPLPGAAAPRKRSA